MGVKNIIYEILCKEQQEVIKSLENQIKRKNEAVLKESRRANEMFQLSYDRKLKLQEQQAEINRLIEIIEQLINDCEYGDFVNLEAAKKALNGKSE